MALEKLKIHVEKGKTPITALFNPTQLTIKKSVNWKTQPTTGRDTPTSQFTHGNPATLTLELFFDTYAERTNVRTMTDKIMALTKVEHHGEIHRPPICTLTWGKFDTVFTGLLQDLTQTFTLFLADGTPVRAKLNCTFLEWRDIEEESRAQNKQSVDVAKTWVVKRGDTLSSIAAAEYEDPGLWRPIAEANRIDNPRALQPGQVLALPALRPDQLGKKR